MVHSEYTHNIFITYGFIYGIFGRRGAERMGRAGCAPSAVRCSEICMYIYIYIYTHICIYIYVIEGSGLYWVQRTR